MNHHMKYAFLVFLFFSASTPKASAFSFTVGNGGQSVVCREPDGRLQSAETFDLFEGRALGSYSYGAYAGREPKELALELARLIDQAQGGSGDGLDSVEGKTRYVLDNFNFLPDGVGLRLTEDSREFVAVPKHCEIVQTINFRSNQKIYVDRAAWEQLDPLSQAALYLHEAVYWHLREGGLESDSRRTRRVVAFLFQGGKLVPRASIEAPKAQYCHTRELNEKGNDWKTKLFVYWNQRGEFVAQLLQLGGYSLLEHTALTSTSITREAGDFPVVPGAAETQTVAGWVRSSTNDEIRLELSWGQGKTQLEATVLEGVKIREELECVDWDLSRENTSR